MHKFDGKSALISGGARGIGAATARLLALEGASVTIGDLPGAGGEQLAEELGAAYIALDVTDEAQWKNAIESVVRRQGALDVLVNAAGIVGDVVNGSLDTTTLAEWRRVLAV